MKLALTGSIIFSGLSIPAIADIQPTFATESDSGTYLSIGAGPNLAGFGGKIAIGQDFGENLRSEVRYSKIVGDGWGSGNNVDVNGIGIRGYWDIHMSETFYPSIGVALQYSWVTTSASSWWGNYSKSISGWEIAPNLQLNFRVNDETDIFIDTDVTFAHGRYVPNALLGARFRF